MLNDLVNFERVSRLRREQRAIHDAARQQLIRIGRWFEGDIHVKRFGDFIDHATPNSEFKTCEVFHASDGFFGVENNPWAVSEESQNFDALVFGCEFWVFAGNAVKSHRQGFGSVT